MSAPTTDAAPGADLDRVDPPAEDAAPAPTKANTKTKTSRKDRRASDRTAKQAEREQARTAERAEQDRKREQRRAEREAKKAAKNAATAQTAALLNYQAQTRVIRSARFAALAGIAGLVTGATAVALVESFHDLYDWAVRHGMTPGWAYWAPLQVDTFIITGELFLLVSIIDNLPRKARIWSWIISMTGLMISVAGNVGHVPAGHPWTWRMTAAVPPLAAAAGITIGMQALKWYMHTMTSRAAERITLAEAPADGVIDEPEPEVTVTAEQVKAERPKPAPKARITTQERPRLELSSGDAKAQMVTPVEPARLDRAMKHHLWEDGVRKWTEAADKGVILTGRRLAEELGVTNREVPTVIANYLKALRNGEVAS